MSSSNLKTISLLLISIFSVALGFFPVAFLPSTHSRNFFSKSGPRPSGSHLSKATKIHYLNGDDALGADLSFLAQKIKVVIKVLSSYTHRFLTNYSSSSLSTSLRSQATQHYDPISSNLYQSYLSYHSNSLTLDSEAFAATTLLLSLHLQRHERPKQTRRVFINFFKVLGAHSSHPPLFGVTVDFNINRIRHATRVLQG